MSDYLLSQGTRATPQSEPIPGSEQVPNSAGGFAWAVDDWTRLRRFLILGSEGGSYYASERTLTIENAESVRACVAADGQRTVKEIVDVSTSGRAPKNDPALYALAVCISLGDIPTKRAVAVALPKVARTGTHLFHFVAYAETMRGWGRTLRDAVAGWYLRAPGDVAYQAVKYRQRDGWSHADLLRLSHPRTDDSELAAVFSWITHGTEIPRTFNEELATPVAPGFGRIINGYMRAQNAATPIETAALIGEYHLPREAVVTDHLTSPDVWAALLADRMPITAMIRNLANMTRANVLTATSDGTRTVLEALGDAETIRKARVHPITVLTALMTYKAGHGLRGGNTWTPVTRIVDALDEAFYLAFGNVTPTGGRTLLALDVSGSMGMGLVAGVPGLTPRVASAAMAMVTARTEQVWECVGFATDMRTLTISSRQRLDDVVRTLSGIPFGGTDCALPMVWAHENHHDYDNFVIYTDSETWHGGVHPMQALRAYRREHVPKAKLVVVGMVSNGFSIADPNDPGSLDVVGFDSATPEIISGFARGEL